MRSRFERAFEAVLWNSRFVVMLAVLGSVVAALALFWITSVDVFYSISHVLGYADAAISEEVRRGVRDNAVTHVVELVDGYLLAAFMLIFALGLYELFISDIDEARRSAASSRILVIDTLDDLKTKLAKVILMILIVRLFEHAVKLRPDNLVELVYLGGTIALVGLALWLTHASEGRGLEKFVPSRGTGEAQQQPAEH